MIHKILGAASLAGALLLTTTQPEEGTAPQRDPHPVVVGTFDSRVVAVAYLRSDLFRSELAALKAEVDRARSAGNDELARSLEERGPAMQRRAHLQGFGTAPIADVLAHIDDRLEPLASQAGVDILVSKWQIAYRSSRVETVDVTDLLASEFAPDEATLEILADLRNTDPLSEAELLSHED